MMTLKITEKLNRLSYLIIIVVALVRTFRHHCHYRNIPTAAMTIDHQYSLHLPTISKIVMWWDDMWK